MGVPIVTLVGNSHAHNVGASILTQIGYNDWIAYTTKEFMNIALALVSDTSELTKIRSELRERMLRSNICNGPKFTRALENAYQNIWADYVQGKTHTSEVNTTITTPTEGSFNREVFLPHGTLTNRVNGNNIGTSNKNRNNGTAENIMASPSTAVPPPPSPTATQTPATPPNGALKKRVNMNDGHVIKTKSPKERDNKT